MLFCLRSQNPKLDSVASASTSLAVLSEKSWDAICRATMGAMRSVVLR